MSYVVEFFRVLLTAIGAFVFGRVPLVPVGEQLFVFVKLASTLVALVEGASRGCGQVRIGEFLAV